MVDVKRRKKAPREDERFLTRARKLWERRPLNSITVEDVRKGMAAESADDHPVRGNRWLASVRACLATAWRSDIIASNPAARVRLNRENPPRARVLSDDELKRVVGAINANKDPFPRTALLMLITTGARLSEVLRARWEDVDLDAATWRIPSPKAGTPQIVPLHIGTVDLLRSLPHTTGPWIIPGRNPQKRRADLKKPWAEVKKASKVTDITIHDLRRTFGLTAARAAGLHVASKLLRHSAVSVTERVYAPLGLDDLRAGLDKVADARANVIPLRKGGTNSA
jgi:integrase